MAALALLQKVKSQIDNTVKFVFVSEGQIIEFSYIDKNDGKDIICVPTQTGCNLGCKFCFLSDYKLAVRNLSAEEISDGVDYVVNNLGLLNKRNRQGVLLVSFMGCGEPLLNLKGVIGACVSIREKYGDNYAVVRFAVAIAGSSLWIIMKSTIQNRVLSNSIFYYYCLVSGWLRFKFLKLQCYNLLMLNEKVNNMEKSKGYIEHPDKAVETGGKFKHVMAITLNPNSSYKEGVIRCIASREGDVATSGYVDRSVLYKAHGDSLDHFSIGEELKIKNKDEIIKQLIGEGLDFLGLEDPDIWIDEKTGLIHLYFTMPFRNEKENDMLIHLGHAVGKDLDSLEMTMPVLIDKGMGCAKEVSIAPANKQGVRFNLVESSQKEEDFIYSTVRVAISEDMGEQWKFGKTAFHPKEGGIPWIGGHASPGPLLPKDFIDVGEGKLLGIMNGREANQRVGNEIKYGTFSVGLFIYDYENGKIDWVSPEPFIQDSQAKTITFASQFVEQGKGSGILYAHVDDSFIRAYSLNAEEIRQLLPDETVS